MQRHKPLFADPGHVGTLANVQTCLRLGDLDEVGDGTHFLSFRMLGLFSFRDMTLQEGVDFWLAFCGDVGLWPDHVTVHPDRLAEWSPLYRGRIPVLTDPDCTWSDGSGPGAYSTEFYVRGVEIGNVVNPGGDCSDCGFGLERMASLTDGAPSPSRVEVLADAALRIIEAGYRPGPNGQGYVLRKLLRLIHREGGTVDHPFMRDEVSRLGRARERYLRLLPRHGDKPAEWWWDTHGIRVEDVTDPPAPGTG